ncbi:AREL1 [Lepeophtheirus salmonis]|uniref:HECT-type E3 ubiquitin transferase n=1 Tax=Lepeophtheirus salmonis TaxID=72036 RepID=A0A7R8CTA2_LEPSM|nr:AREL1 [Lepeophtheirus salmonis]CAF2922304.1 AREL1 [Lepeophtheirus salmonis]
MKYYLIFPNNFVISPHKTFQQSVTQPEPILPLLPMTALTIHYKILHHGYYGIGSVVCSFCTNFPSVSPVSNTKYIRLYYIYGIKSVTPGSISVKLQFGINGDKWQIITNETISEDQLKIFFSGKMAGLYTLTIGFKHVYYVKSYRFYLTNLEPDPASIHFEDEKEFFVQRNRSISLKIFLKDVYGNEVLPTESEINHFKIESDLTFRIFSSVLNMYARTSSIKEGCSKVKITYKGTPIKTPKPNVYWSLLWDLFRGSYISSPITDIFKNKTLHFKLNERLFLLGSFVNAANKKCSMTFDEKLVEFFSNFEYMGELIFLMQSIINVDRHCLLYSSIKSLEQCWWIGPLRISFSGEQGIEYGGLRREWYTLLWKELSDTKIFITNERGTYGPNPLWKDLNIFEFAGKILGKALSLGANPMFRLYLPFSFSSSFLYQLKGINIGYRHFKVDYPEFYTSRIDYIVKNKVEDLDLYFTDEIYDEKGHLIESKNLKPSGKKIKVTNFNKFEYLHLLAKYRLSDRIKGPLTKFKTGLHYYVSETYLANFDESEMDLLFSGFSTIDFNDLKKHHNCQNVSHKIMEWFWLVLEHLSEEQKLLFLKFITGSSRLPPNGFKDLCPVFTIRQLNEEGKLPSSHVCANVLNIHPHSSFEAFESSFITAITEGYVGRMTKGIKK